VNVEREGSTVLQVVDLNIEYSGKHGIYRAVDDVSFEVRSGEFVSIVGPSGAGKSTLLKAIAGLLPVRNGTIQVAGERVQNEPPKHVAVVFQDYSRSLFPWMTVRRNVEFPLRGGRYSREEIERRTTECLAAVGLSDAANKYPWQLSGGMQQRVAIARALAYRPSLLLMDEPMASVDAQTRADLEDLLLAVHARFGMTILLVTHDIDESVYLSDRVLVLSRPPARLVEDLEVRLPRPRHQLRTRELPDFARLRNAVAHLILTGGEKVEVV
jgi:NitT/TauT family transport system ATP-binding protein